MYHGNRHRIAGGFLGNLVHGIGGALKGAVGGILTGNPLAAITGAIGGSVRSVASHASITGAGTDTAGDAARLARVKAHHAAALRHHATAAIGGSQAATPAGAAMTSLQLGAGGGGGGRRRRMNWANTRALGRAERRIHSAVKHMTKYIRWVHPKKEGHAAPKFRRKK